VLEAAKSRRRSARPPAVSLCRAAGFLTLGLVLCGCVGHGLESTAPIAPDKSLITGSIPESTTETSDRDAVREAVASAGARLSESVSIPWADPTTGTVGVIISLSQSQSTAGTCRSFTTTRHSYEGIALYAGRACKFDGAPWRLVKFGPKHGAADSAVSATG
jgi:hypothetical protein